jgi:hypothetical protein
MKLAIVATTAAALLSSSSTTAFVQSKLYLSRQALQSLAATETASVDTRTGKPTGTSFLPEEVVERALVGNPIEKAKMAKDGTSAFVDVYEYARKIREGEMTWEEVDKADLDTVSYSSSNMDICTSSPQDKPHAYTILFHI